MYIVRHEDGFDVSRAQDCAWNEPLTVHKGALADPTTLVLFVHGLGGQGKGTWGAYPQYIFEDFGADVGLFNYESGHRRRPFRSISIDNHAKTLAHTIRDVPYSNIILVGHSMGGLLCKSAVKYLIDGESRDSRGLIVMDKVKGLGLFATPQAGSNRVFNILRIFSKDARVLRSGSGFVSEVTQRFQDRVSTGFEDAPRATVFRLPTFAIIANGDYWVDQLSAGLGLRGDQQKIVTGTHTSVVKPSAKTDDAYMWFCEQVRRCIPSPSSAIEVGNSASEASQIEALKQVVSRLLQGDITLPIHTYLGPTDAETPGAGQPAVQGEEQDVGRADGQSAPTDPTSDTVGDSDESDGEVHER